MAQTILEVFFCGLIMLTIFVFSRRRGPFQKNLFSPNNPDICPKHIFPCVLSPLLSTLKQWSLSTHTRSPNYTHKQDQALKQPLKNTPSGTIFPLIVLISGSLKQLELFDAAADEGSIRGSQSRVWLGTYKANRQTL